MQAGTKVMPNYRRLIVSYLEGWLTGMLFNFGQKAYGYETIKMRDHYLPFL